MADCSDRASRIADIAARTLFRHGVRHGFGMPGGEVVTFIDALEAAGVRFVLARHETAAGFMAAGEACERGAPGLLVTTVGPGLANGLNAIADAKQEFVPLIVVSGVVDHDVRGRYTHQVYDQAAMVRPFVKASFEIEREGAGATVARAIRLAMTHPKGPVHLDLAPGTAAAIATPSDRDFGSMEVAQPSLSGDDEAISGLARKLTEAERPLILAGFEAARSDCSAALTRLAEHLGAAVITTYKGKGVVPETHALNLGAAGLSPLADTSLLPVAKSADVVLLAGYDPIEMRPGWFDPFSPEAHVAALTACPPDHGMHEAAVVLIGGCGPLVSSLERAVTQLGTAVSPRGTCRWPCGAPGLAREKLAASFAVTPAKSDNGVQGLTPHEVFEDLQSVIRPDTVVSVDSGAHRILLSQMLKVGKPMQLQQSAGFCTMGAAVPMALGLKLAQPERHVIAVVGDGGLEMGLGELATLRDQGIAITIVVLQDESLALIELKQAGLRLAKAGVELGPTPFEDVAKTYRGTGIRARSRHELRQALAQAERSDRFSLIACPVKANDYVDKI